MRYSQQSMSTVAILIRDRSLEVVLYLCVVSVINFIVDLVKRARHVFFVDSRDT